MKAAGAEAVIYILQTLETIYLLASLKSLLMGTSLFEPKGWLKRTRV